MQQLLLKKQPRQLTPSIKDKIWCPFKQLEHALDKVVQVDLNHNQQEQISKNNKCNNYPQKWNPRFKNNRGHHNK